MTPEQLQELEEKAKLWDELSPLLKTIHGSKFERPSNGTTKIENTSNASTFIDVLKEEAKDMVSENPTKACKCFTFAHRDICQECFDKDRIKYLTQNNN